MNFQQYWEIVRGRMNVVLIALIAVVSATAISLYFTPKTYTAQTMISFDFSGSNPYASVGSPSGVGEGSYIATQVEIIRSTQVSAKIVKSLSPEDRDRLIEAFKAKETLPEKWWRELMFSITKMQADETDGDKDQTAPVGEDYEWLVYALPSDLDVKPVIGSRILSLSYESTDPYVAAMIANAYAQAYIDTNLEMIINPARQAKAWFDERLKQLRAKVEEAQQKLTQFQQSQGIVATGDRYDIESKRLLDLTAQLTKAQEERRRLETARTQILAMQTEGESLLSLPEVLQNSVVQNIKSEIRSLEAKLVELSNRLGSNHPQFKRVEAELAAARSRLRAEVKSIIAGVDNAVRLARQNEQAARQAVENQKALVLSMRNQRGEIDVLLRELESAQSAYNAALDQFNKTSLQSLVTQANVSLVEGAVIPRRPSGPKVGQNLVLALIVGLMLGIGLAFLLEMVDRRVRSAEDFITELNIPFLGTVERI